MEKQISKANTELTNVSDIDPLVAYADAISPRHIVGKLLRFSKGDFFAGEESEPIPAGTTLTVAADELLAGWIRWFDSKPTEHNMVRVADGKQPPKRGDLGDQDHSTWETDDRGEPRDPWQFTNYLPMMDENSELYTFTTSSTGGLTAVSDVVRRNGQHRRHHPDVYPIVTLGVDSYHHKKRNTAGLSIQSSFRLVMNRRRSSSPRWKRLVCLLLRSRTRVRFYYRLNQTN
jgi:hypothetical protein